MKLLEKKIYILGHKIVGDFLTVIRSVTLRARVHCKHRELFFKFRYLFTKCLNRLAIAVQEKNCVAPAMKFIIDFNSVYFNEFASRNFFAAIHEKRILP